MKKNNYVKMDDQKCIAAIVAVAVISAPLEIPKFLLMVAWEYQTAAKQGHFKCYKMIVEKVTKDTIDECADYGSHLSDTEIKKFFPFLLK